MLLIHSRHLITTVELLFFLKFNCLFCVYSSGRPAPIDDADNVDWAPTLKLSTSNAKSSTDKTKQLNEELGKF